MKYDSFKKIKMNKHGVRSCVIIRTREEGSIVEIDKNHDKLLVVAKRHGYAVMQEQWFNYTEIEIW